MIDLKISRLPPPNYEEIKKHFKLSPHTVFTYGDTIHNPGGGPISDHLKHHESVHSVQQAEMGGPEVWWAKYLIDPEWRLQQEIEAYREQFKMVSEAANRAGRRKWLSKIAGDLASPIYGDIISKAEAMRQIENE